jgi:DNA mismatch repair protein MutS
MPTTQSLRIPAYPTLRGDAGRVPEVAPFERAAALSEAESSARALPEAARAGPGPAPGGSPFRSILFPDAAPGAAPGADGTPSCLHDLNLDQIIAGVIAGREDYGLRDLFLRPAGDVGVITYRHDVFRDLDSPEVLGLVRAFAAEMRAMREHLTTAGKLYYKEQKDAWHVHATEIYLAAVDRLASGLARCELGSRGLALFRDYLLDYTRSSGFLALASELRQLQRAIAQIRYCLRIKSGSIRVHRYSGEEDYTAAVRATFARFQQRAGKDHLVKFHDFVELNHIEAAILARISRLYPAAFAELAAYCERHRGYCDDKIAGFDREIQFYLGYLDHIAPLRRAGLPFCYPRLSPASKAVRVADTFDLALASRLVREGGAVVGNDFHLAGRERILVVSGPNQGGKTTFARTFGQLHYLARLGLPVPGRQAQLFLCDRILTHFEKEERVENLRGKLEDDLIRIRQVLDQATASSVIVLNEIFTSTSLQDAVFLGRQVLGRIIRLDALCVCVTFIDELAALGEQTVSMLSTVAPENPAQRTYKIVRRPADGLAYALTLAERYRLTYEALRRRLAP